MVYTSVGEWKYVEKENGDIIIETPNGHNIHIGNIKDMCGGCLANAQVIALTPKLIEAASKLLEKIETITNSDEYRSVFVFAFAHGFLYMGDTWREEYDVLSSLVAQARGDRK